MKLRCRLHYQYARNCQIRKCSNAQIRKCSNAPMLKCCNAPMLKCSNAQCSNAQLPNVPMLQCSTAQIPQHAPMPSCIAPDLASVLIQFLWFTSALRSFASLSLSCDCQTDLLHCQCWYSMWCHTHEDLRATMAWLPCSFLPSFLPFFTSGAVHRRNCARCRWTGGSGSTGPASWSCRQPKCGCLRVWPDGLIGHDQHTWSAIGRPANAIN